MRRQEGAQCWEVSPAANNTFSKGFCGCCVIAPEGVHISQHLPRKRIIAVLSCPLLQASTAVNRMQRHDLTACLQASTAVEGRMRLYDYRFVCELASEVSRNASSG